MPLLNSNHNPVEILFDFNYESTHSFQIYDFKNTNWVLFKNQLNNNIDLHFHIKDKLQLEQKCSQFTEIIQCAIRDIIPIKIVNHNIVNYPKYIKILIRIKNKLRKKISKSANKL